MLTVRLRSTTKRVSLASPPTRTSLATGKSPLSAGGAGAGPGTCAPAAKCPASVRPSIAPAMLVARFRTESQASPTPLGSSYSNRPAWLTESCHGQYDRRTRYLTWHGTTPGEGDEFHLRLNALA